MPVPPLTVPLFQQEGARIQTLGSGRENRIHLRSLNGDHLLRPIAEKEKTAMFRRFFDPMSGFVTSRVRASGRRRQRKHRYLHLSTEVLEKRLLLSVDTTVVGPSEMVFLAAGMGGRIHPGLFFQRGNLARSQPQGHSAIP